MFVLCDLEPLFWWGDEIGLLVRFDFVPIFCWSGDAGLFILYDLVPIICKGSDCLYCIEVLRPSQPNGVMSSAVSLPNHTYKGSDTGVFSLSDLELICWRSGDADILVGR